MSNTIGILYKLTTFGESHGAAVGGVIDGCPAGLTVDMSRLEALLERRRPGSASAGVSSRAERDEVEFLSGIFEGRTLGSPIAFIVRNTDARSNDYDRLKTTCRVGHADATYDMKYGVRDYRGGGRASARCLLPVVVAGSIALQLLEKEGVAITTTVESVGELSSEPTENAINQYLDNVKRRGETVGAVVRGHIHGVKAGLGEPMFDKFHARLGAAMLSINTAKGFEIDEGFRRASMLGNASNNEGYSIEGGITNGNDISFRVVFKPIPTVGTDSRHDACVVPRVMPIVESLTALTLLDFMFLARNNTIRK